MRACGARIVTLVSLSVLYAGCAMMEVPHHPEPVQSSDIGLPETWGGVDNVVSVEHLYLSGMPDEATLAEAAKRGVGMVIDLREPEEYDWDEAAAAEALGMTYHAVPLARRSDSFDMKAISKVSGLVNANQEQKILIHCSTANRAGGWFATHLIRHHAMGVDPSIALAREAGLRSGKTESRVRHFIRDMDTSMEALHRGSESGE